MDERGLLGSERNRRFDATARSSWYRARDRRNYHGDSRDDREMDDLKSAIDDLTAKVERLVALQTEARKPDQ